MARAPKPLPLHAQDLPGLTRLLTEATLGVTDIVEAMHARIASPPLLPAGASGRTAGLTRQVYGAVRGVTRGVGKGLDLLLARLPAAPGPELQPPREAWLAALNGVLGDHLQRSANPLAIPMRLRAAGQSQRLLPDELPLQPGAGLLLLVHGLCMNDLQWQQGEQDHGAQLAQALGLQPLYLHYNTGLPIAANARELAGLLAQLHARAPQQRLVLLGHSMGGLLLRSALYQAQGAAWTRAVSHLLCLGSPHLGAPLERAGRGVDLLLGAAPYAAPLARLGKVRSAGITDLRHGRLLDSGPVDRAPRAAVPLPPGVTCHALAGTLGARAAAKTRLLGDGLVPLNSALGLHRNPALCLNFPAAHQHVFEGLGHIELLGSAAVGQRLLEIVQSSGSNR
ncbi:lipase family alpha/beta hydrolase [Inhella sp.]|uniref:lipase family alpha/beta hydrolase n=1 Tax=Inhella sp. TaxID=1921806 RepID=UPI0035AE783C